MSRYSLTTEAQNDLREIREYLLQRAGVRVTRRVIVSLIAAFRSLARTPGLGHRREDLTTHDELRFWRVFWYLIVYRNDRKPLTIIAILDGRRDVERILGGRESPKC